MQINVRQWHSSRPEICPAFKREVLARLFFQSQQKNQTLDPQTAYHWDYVQWNPVSALIHSATLASHCHHFSGHYKDVGLTLFGAPKVKWTVIYIEPCNGGKGVLDISSLLWASFLCNCRANPCLVSFSWFSEKAGLNKLDSSYLTTGTILVLSECSHVCEGIPSGGS